MPSLSSREQRHPILTSDVPIIINGAMNDDHGCLILPLSTNEFFVAYNLGKIDMKKEISEFCR